MTPDFDATPLHELAAAHGVGLRGPGGVATPQATLRAVLEALGVPASTDAEVALGLARHHDHWRPLPAVVTAHAGRGQRVTAWVPEGCPARAFVTPAAGADRDVPVEPRPDLARPAGRDSVVPVTVVVPGDLPVGHHLLTVDFEVSGATAPLVVAPPVLPGAPAAVRWGLGGATGQVRATASGGPADLDDLAEVVSWAGADLGADFVVTPAVHGGAVPFAPAALVRPERVPEHAALDDRTRGLLATGPRSTALRTLYAAPRSPRRQRAFEAFCVAGGQALLDHATWLTIASRHGEDVAAWPRPLRASGGDAVARLREDAADEVNFHRWCQWVADEQLTEAVREARRTGMRLGLVSPVSPPGAVDAGQAWSLGCAPARGVRLGRPPGAGDPHGAVGDQRPWAPTTLRDLALEPLRRHLDAVTRRADGLLLTLPERWLRQWWVPEGAPAAEGAWVEQDHDALLAAVAVAAHRSGAVVLADVRGLAAREAEWLLAQGVVPVVEGGAGAGTARGALRWVDIGTLAEEAPGPLVLDRLAGSPSVRRRARSLAR